MTAPLQPMLPEDGLQIPSVDEMFAGYGGEPVSRGPLLQTPVDPDLPDDPEAQVERKREAMRALYGENFPLANEQEPTLGDWAKWGEDLWDRHQPEKRRILHNARRNRLMRKGIQWIDCGPGGTWEEPPRPKNASRVVNNLIGPALDQRVQIVSEQRPGPKTRPMTQDPDDLRKAEAQQVLLEYQYDEQGMAGRIAEASFYAGTDGATFWLVHWDADAGEYHQEQTEDPDNPGTFLLGGRYPKGDPRVRPIKIENIVVSANATANTKPHYVVIRETIPLTEAIAFHGSQVVRPGRGDHTGNKNNGYISYLDTDERLEGQETVNRLMVFCAPTEDLPEGLVMVAVGGREVLVDSLPIDCIPVVRFTDGSTDPAYFPIPVMDAWIDHQVRINATLSKLVDSVRINSGGRFFAKQKAIGTETLVGGLFSLIEVRTAGSITDAVQPVKSFSVGADAMNLIASELRAFEQKSGYSAESQGKISGEASGRAILAAREQTERIVAPPIGAAAKAMTEWGKITLKWAAWGYDLPRIIGITGHGRPDLAREITKDDLDGICDVAVDPETLMPMPTPLRMYLLDQLQEKGLIDAKEYRRRYPFAFIRNLDTPDEDQMARAQRVAEAILEGQPPPPLRWQTNESIEQDVLERRIILRDDLDEMIVQAANARWMECANQAMLKMGGMPAPGAGAPAPPGGQGGSPFAPSPATQPIPLNNPGVSAGSAAQQSGFDQDSAARQFDNTRPQ